MITIGLLIATGCFLVPNLGGLVGDYRATLDIGGECSETLETGADVAGFDNGSASITFFTPERGRDENCSEGFAWDWSADEGVLGPFSANACLFGLDIFLNDGGTLVADGDGWSAAGTGGIEEIGVAELCSGPYEIVFDPR